MSRESNINTILNELLKNGSKIDYLKELKLRSLELVKKDIDLDEALSIIAKEIKEQTLLFLNQKNDYDVNYISGISTCIYLPDFNGNGEYKLKLFGGKGARTKSLKITESTLFDIDSITKLYTLILLFRLEEQGLINLNDKISDINPDFQNLEDFTLNDLIRLHGELKTNGNITQAKSQEEAYTILKTLYLTSNSREENKYTDFGSIVISDTIEKIIEQKTGKKMSFEDIMCEYLLNPLSLYKTQFNPLTHDLSGNGNKRRLVYDTKARILGGALGSAGLFTTSEDLARLARSLYRVNYYTQSLLTKKNLAKLGEITFPNSSQSNRGNLGLYVKHPLGYSKTFTPSEFSDGSFSHQGTTGSVAVFDPNNLIHNSILVNTIYNSIDKEIVKDDKPVGFETVFEEYQNQITRNIMLMYVAKQYYNRYLNVKENIEVTKYI